MKKIIFVCFVALLLACRSASVTPTPGLATPSPTASLKLGSVSAMMLHFESQYQFTCETNRDHWRCFSPNQAIKIVFFNDPVTEATISIPLSEADNKPAKYIQALVFKTGLDAAAWEWLTPHLNDTEISRDFGSRRLTSQSDNEGWLITVEFLE